MLRFALIGRSISHSRSQVVYDQIAPGKVQFDFYDVDVQEELPSAQELIQRYDAFHVTAPYKKHYIDQVDAPDYVQELEALNFVYRVDGRLVGANTDYLALKTMLKDAKYELSDNIYVLGDGGMARVWCQILTEYGKSFAQIARKMGGNPTEYEYPHGSTLINCISRGVEFPYTFSETTFFWDMNYANESVQQGARYIDGEELLLQQAREAYQLYLSK